MLPYSSYNGSKPDVIIGHCCAMLLLEYSMQVRQYGRQLVADYLLEGAG